MADALRYSDALLIRMTPEMKAAINGAARHRGAKVVEWVRAALEKALRSDSSEQLADRQFALVAQGELVVGRHGHAITTFRPAPDPRGEWLEIANEDSAPLDPEKHWRLAPLPLRVDGKRVVRTYPIAVKVLELA